MFTEFSQNLIREDPCESVANFGEVGYRTCTRNGWFSAGISAVDALEVGYEQLGEDEKPPQNRNKSVHTNGAFTRRPGKHQDPIERHKFLGPDESSYTENQVRLHDKAKDQIEIKLFHKVIPGGTQILLHQGWGLGREIRGFCGDHSAKTGPEAQIRSPQTCFENIKNKSPIPPQGSGRMGQVLSPNRLFLKFQSLRQFKGDV